MDSQNSLSRHLSLLAIHFLLGVDEYNCTSWSTLSCPCMEVHSTMSFMSSFLFLQQNWKETCYLVNIFGHLFCSGMFEKRQRMYYDADKKNTTKRKWYKQVQIYTSTIHEIKHFKTLVF